MTPGTGQRLPAAAKPMACCESGNAPLLAMAELETVSLRQ